MTEASSTANSAPGLGPAKYTRIASSATKEKGGSVETNRVSSSRNLESDENRSAKHIKVSKGCLFIMT